MRYLALLLFSNVFWGAPIGNPSVPSLLEEGFFIPDQAGSDLQVNFSWDFLLQKKMKNATHSSGPFVQKISLSGTSQKGGILWNIRERANLFITLGNSAFDWEWMDGNRQVNGSDHRGISYEAGAQCVLIEMKDSSLAANGQIGGWNGSSARSWYWQSGVALTQKIWFLSPYIGCMVNQTVFRTETFRFLSQVVAGPFLGCSVTTGSCFLANLEWRGYFEEGVTFSGQIRF